MTTSHDPIPVQIVDTGHGTTPEPGLDQDWSDLDKLRWHAGVLQARTGVQVKIVTDVRIVSGHPLAGFYGWSMIGSSGGAMPYHEMWTFLNGVEVGARTRVAS